LGKQKNNYDIYYVRNNKEIFLKLPKNKLKLWFASPYIESCYDYADKVVCLTENWKKMLLNVNKNWGILYPPNFTCLKTIVFSQKLDPNIIYYKKIYLRFVILEVLGIYVIHLFS
jgi:hypothetical protein